MILPRSQLALSAESVRFVKVWDHPYPLISRGNRSRPFSLRHLHLDPVPIRITVVTLQLVRRFEVFGCISEPIRPAVKEANEPLKIGCLKVFLSSLQEQRFGLLMPVVIHEQVRLTNKGCDHPTSNAR